MHEIKISIYEFIDSHQPGWVRCKLKDSNGKEWEFNEKIPVVSLNDLSKEDIYPKDGAIRGEIVKSWKNETGLELVRVTTKKPDDVESIDGENEFDLFASQIKEIN